MVLREQLCNVISVYFYSQFAQNTCILYPVRMKNADCHTENINDIGTFPYTFPAQFHW